MIKNIQLFIPVVALTAGFYVISNMIVGARFFALSIPLIGHRTFPSSMALYPFVMPLGDVTTVAYGKKIARGIVFSAFLLNLIVVFVLWMLRSHFPPAVNPELGSQFDLMFSATPKILIFSGLSYLGGELVNIWVLTRLNNKLKIRWPNMSLVKILVCSFILSTAFGQGVDSLIFFPGAFYGNPDVSSSQLLDMAVNNWLGKFVVECLALPITVPITMFMMRAEKLELPYDEQYNAD